MNALAAPIQGDQPSPPTKGKRVVYVTNDVAINGLQDELSRALQAAHFKYAAINPDSTHRIDGLAQSVAQGNYDFVLFSERFTRHSTWKKLLAAARRSPRKCEFVYVGKGRAGEVLRALSEIQKEPLMKVYNGPKGEGSVPRWTGAELARLEDLVKDHRSPDEIALILKNEFGSLRTSKAVAHAAWRYFTGANRTEPPAAYHVYRQAQRIRGQIEAQQKPIEIAQPADSVAAPVPPPQLEPALPPSPLAPVVAAIPTPPPPAPKPQKKIIYVEIKGQKGNTLVECERPLHEILAFLMGES